MTTQVTLTECYGERRTFVTTHRNAETAQQLAISKAYGRGKFLCVDSGLTTPGSDTRYGQIGHYIDRARSQISTDTGRVRVELESVA